MKRYLLFLLTSLMPMLASAYGVQIDGIYYNLNSATKTAEVTKEIGDGEGTNSYFGSVDIPATVTYNGVAYSVTSIGDWAFNDCSGITSLTIPNSVTSIGEGAFNGCSGLTSVTIGNSVASIGNWAFAGCDNAKELIYADGCKEALAIGLTSIEKVTIPNSITSIRDYAFYFYNALTSVTIPSSVTSIGEGAFNNCSCLTSLTIPSSVTSIGEDAFNFCPGLTSVKVETGNTTYDSREGCNAIIETSSNTLIQGCQSTVIPSSVTCIGPWAFYGCSSLTSLTIPSSVTSIGNYAFCYCSGLTSVKVETGNTTYDSREGCNAIIETSSNTLIQGCQSTVIPNSVTSIGNAAFADCFGLTSLTIPTSVTSIGEEAFSGCSGLTSLTIPASVTSIGEEAFVACLGLTSVKVETGNTAYDSREGCNAIIETSSNTLIQGCQSTVIPASVTSIGDRAFFFCSGFTSLTIPNSVTNIGDYAFGYCSDLTSLTIGNSVTSIGEDAFVGCYSIRTIHSHANVPPTLVSNFFDISTIDVELYVPLGTKEDYAQANGWDAFLNIIEEDTDDMANSITTDGIGEKWGDVEYFTLDGVKVGEPTNGGIYIVKKTSQTKKSVLKK